MTFILTLAAFAASFGLLGITLILTGKSGVHTSCAATEILMDLDILEKCEFCPNSEPLDTFTTLATAGYPGRSHQITEELYSGKPDLNAS